MNDLEVLIFEILDLKLRHNCSVYKKIAFVPLHEKNYEI